MEIIGGLIVFGAIGAVGYWVYVRKFKKVVPAAPPAVTRPFDVDGKK